MNTELRRRYRNLFIYNKSNIEQIFKKYDKLKIVPNKMTAYLKIVKYKVDKKKVGTTDKIENKFNEHSFRKKMTQKKMEKLNNIIKECDTIVELVEKNNEFSERGKILAIYIKNIFWINLIKEYNNPQLN